MTATRERWSALWSHASLSPPTACFDQLLAHYVEPQRHYHTLQHISECLREFDEARGLAKEPNLIEFAIWFHDVIYDPRAHDNEERSAQFAVDCLRAAAAPSNDVARVRQLVLATKHHVANSDDESLLIDIDLSILGQSPERFSEYERQIRDEYSWVPADVFSEKRAEVLQRFLHRPRLYTTQHFSARYEQQARTNLAQSLLSLGHANNS